MGRVKCFLKIWKITNVQRKQTNSQSSRIYRAFLCRRDQLRQIFTWLNPNRKKYFVRAIRPGVPSVPRVPNQHRVSAGSTGPGHGSRWSTVRIRSEAEGRRCGVNGVHKDRRSAHGQIWLDLILQALNQTSDRLLRHHFPVLPSSFSSSFFSFFFCIFLSCHYFKQSFPFSLKKQIKNNTKKEQKPKNQDRNKTFINNKSNKSVS